MSIVRWIVWGVAAMLVGCASVPMESMEDDARAKTFAPEPDRASLYIYRNETFGAAVPMNLSINGRIIGQSASKTYFFFRLQPGTYSVESTAENVAQLSLDMAPGKNYFVWQEVKIGMWMARSQLHHVDEAVGRAGVLESKMAVAQVAEDELRPRGVSGPHPANTTLDEKLRQLQKLYEERLISEQEYQQKRKELIERF